MRRPIWSALCCALAAMTAPAAAAPLRVVASIKPVQSLVAGVMKDIGEPTVIVPGGASVHTYSLRPSDASALNRADLVFWIGPDFERFLLKPIETLGGGARSITLMGAPGVKVLPAREGGLWEPHADDHAAEGHEHAEEMDGHIWLDPANAGAMVMEIARVLRLADPANAPRYDANAAAVVQRIAALDREVQGIVAPVRNRPFIVFHDAYQYFERHFGVAATGSITVAADRSPGARRIAAIRAKIAAHEAVCVFAEPQFEPKLVRTVLDGTTAQAGVLDPEGSTLPAGEALYGDLMRTLATDLARCLGH